MKQNANVSGAIYTYKYRIKVITQEREKGKIGCENLKIASPTFAKCMVIPLLVRVSLV